MLVLGLVLAALSVAGPAAAAKKSCGDAVIADWYGDGRVDKVFPLPCYQQAIRSLPVDVLDYSNAKEDILRALAFARKGEKDPGAVGREPDDGERDGEPERPGRPARVTERPEPSGRRRRDGTDASGAVDTSGPSSVPLPLLILGGLALLLLAAGGVGYLSRRSQSRREGGPPGPA